MADLKISQLNAAEALTGAELVEVVQDGANVRTTAGALSADKLPATGGTLGAYAETGATLTPINGVLTIPLNNLIYAVTVTAAITEIRTVAPALPTLGSAIVHFKQDGTGGYAVSLPAAWEWADKFVTGISTTANARTRLLLTQNPFGTIDADAELRGVPA